MAETLRTRIGRKLAEHRKAHGLSQAAVAKSAGVGVHYLSDVERGAANPTVEFFERLESVLDWKLDDLFTAHISEAMRRELLARTSELRNRLDALEGSLAGAGSPDGEQAVVRDGADGVEG